MSAQSHIGGCTIPFRNPLLSLPPFREFITYAAYLPLFSRLRDELAGGSVKGARCCGDPLCWTH